VKQERLLFCKNSDVLLTQTMDFPLFHLDWLGNRMLIAITAIIHVLINHPLAVGAYPLLTLFEWWGWKHQDRAWDDLTRRILFIVFVITTTLGAMTGVGIWLTTSLVAPFAIGSLLRVFFWAWFTEWLVFVTEVILILAYYLTWTRLTSPAAKRWHIRIGAALSAFSWLTMALIVAILGFMMNSGVWGTERSLLAAVFNPMYVPQLAFRTTFAMTTSGLFVWFCICFSTAKGSDLRHRAIRFSAGWSLAWLPLCAGASLWYWKAVPASMKAQAGIATLTQAFSQWHVAFLQILAASVALILLTAAIGYWRPAAMPRYALVVPMVMAAWWLGHFERVREFIRKPYVIAGYMYSNGVRVDELPVFQRDGVLPYATYARVRKVTPTNQLAAGRELFMLTCSRCHTVNGINSVKDKLLVLKGRSPWDKDELKDFLQGMHLTRTYMPPFPGNAAEAEALATYLVSLHPNAAAQPLANALLTPQ
jgi:mono/diheme cytochrome c family protein